MARILSVIWQFLAITLATVVLLELGGAAYYYANHRWSTPPVFGGPPLQTSRYLDSFGFDPVTLYSVLDQPLNEDLWARELIDLPPKEPDEYRVFLVGGSTVANIRMPPGERIADFMQSGLRAAGRKARVFNFGVPSYQSYQELTLVVGKLVYQKPDMIVVYNGVNDAFYGSVMRDWRPNETDVTEHYRRRFYEDIRLQLTPLQRLNYLLDGASYTKYLVEEIRIGKRASQVDDMRRYTARDWADKIAATREQACAGPLPPPVPAFGDQARVNPEAVDVFAGHVQLMRQASNKAGIAFVHVLQPTAFTKKKLYPCERFSIDFNNASYKDMQRVWIATYDLMRERLRRDSSRWGAGSLHVDLSRFTDDMDAYLYDDFCHAWRQGPLTRIVGEEIARHILPMVSTPAGTGSRP